MAGVPPPDEDDSAPPLTPGAAAARNSTIRSDRKLRKFASETSFITADTVSQTSEDALDDRVDQADQDQTPVVPVPSRSRMFMVRTYGSRQPPPVNGQAGKLISAARRAREDSDDLSVSVDSQTTVQSATMTPLSRRKLRFRLRRPKSAGMMGGSATQLNTSQTSTTIRSLDSIQPLMLSGEDAALADRNRRTSNVYILDDDSMHEFGEDISGLSSSLIA
uniref:Uncharacterized protein n=1 Tax=Plectus sambesii TaxID=2011161 RepID=A0A914UN70_9BILA